MISSHITMKKLRHLIILLYSLSLSSCKFNNLADENDVEIWETELISMKSKTVNFNDNFADHSQYLYLYQSGKAVIIDSLKDGIARKSESKWEIQTRNARNIFLFGFGKESQGIVGVAYPIHIKNETEFKMLFDSLDETHIWNLKRIH